MTPQAVVLFDGVCNLCNATVDCILRRDPRGRFAFASIQSEAGQTLLADLGVHDALESIVLVDVRKTPHRVHRESGAVLRICWGLRGAWKAFAAFLVVPWFLRDWVYGIIAKRRYKWWGQRETCRLPTPDERGRFLETAADLGALDTARVAAQ